MCLQRLYGWGTQRLMDLFHDIRQKVNCNNSKFYIYFMLKKLVFVVFVTKVIDAPAKNDILYRRSYRNFSVLLVG